VCFSQILAPCLHCTQFMMNSNTWSVTTKHYKYNFKPQIFLYIQHPNSTQGPLLHFIIVLKVCAQLVVGNTGSKIVILLKKIERSRFHRNIYFGLVWHWFVKIMDILSYVIHTWGITFKSLHGSYLLISKVLIHKIHPHHREYNKLIYHCHLNICQFKKRN